MTRAKLLFAAGVITVGLLLLAGLRWGRAPGEPAAASPWPEGSRAAESRPSWRLAAEPTDVRSRETAQAGQSLEPSPGHLAASTESPAIRIAVLTRDAAGRPVAGVRVHATLKPSFSFATIDSAGPADAGVATTDQEGTAELAFSETGAVAIRAWSELTGRNGALGEAHVKAHAPGDYAVELALRPAKFVSGVVVDGRNSSPIPGARVSCYARPGLGLEPEITGADGRFEVGPLEAEVLTGVSAKAVGYGEELVKITIRENGSWECPARFGWPELSGASEPFLKIELVPEKRVLGTVVDAGETPIAGANVRVAGLLLIRENVAKADTAQAQTDQGGRFFVDGLRSDVTHAIVTSAPGQSARIDHSPAHDLETNLGTYPLIPGNELTGEVVTSLGAPLEGIEVLVTRWADPKVEPELSPMGGANTVRDGWGRFLSLQEAKVFTDVRGVFRFECVGDGEFILSVRIGRNVLHEQEVQVMHGTHRLDPIVVQPLASTREGLVTRSGQPVPNVLVQVAPQGSEPLWSVATDAVGRFRLPGAKEGANYLVRVLSSEQELFRGRSFTSGAGTLRIELETSGR